MPGREQLCGGRRREAWWARASRRHALPEGSHPAGWPRGRTGWALLLAWLVASAALLAFTLVISLGGEGGCTGRCAAQAPGRDHGPAVPVSTGQFRPRQAGILQLRASRGPSSPWLGTGAGGIMLSGGT